LRRRNVRWLLFLTIISLLLVAVSERWSPEGRDFIHAAAIDDLDGEPLPLMDMVEADRYLREFRGGLYLGSSNLMPLNHAEDGLDFARDVEPLDLEGKPDPAGKFVLLSIGMSNTKSEFEKFIELANANDDVDQTKLAIVNGARSGQDAMRWVLPDSDNYKIIKSSLEDQGLSEAQVQIVWLKVANNLNSGGAVSLPSPDSDAFKLVKQLGAISRTLKFRYPNLRQLFVSSRIYAGFANVNLNPEPFAYESGFSVKWLLEAQIYQVDAGGAHPDYGGLTGNLDYGMGVAPWISWGPYLWAGGDEWNPRSDGLSWHPDDFTSDGTHPSSQGAEKVGMMLMDFFETSTHARCWFLDKLSCEPVRLFIPIIKF
jgi:hypothetical protein